MVVDENGLTLFTKMLLGHRLIHPSSFITHQPCILSSFFSKQLFCIRAIPTPAYASLNIKTTGWAPCMASSIVGRRAAYSTQSVSTNEPVVSVDWLYDNLKEPDLKVLDASWYMPDEQRNPIQEYQVAHIPGALFFDVDGIADWTTNLPHMLPSEGAFAAAVSALGIQNKDNLVVYDGKGLCSAVPVWWMFQVYGHDRVWVLDGGLPRWRASGYDVESSASTDAILKASAAGEAIEKVYQGQTVGPLTFQTKFQPHLVWTLDQVKKSIEDETHQHIDARSKPRFDGAALEPRMGIRSSQVPGSKCIPFGQLLDSSQTLLPADELKKRFDQEVVTLCGTGVTACILALGNKIDNHTPNGSSSKFTTDKYRPFCSSALPSLKPLVPLFLRPSVYSTKLYDLKNWHDWAKNVALSIGSTFVDSDNGPDSSLLCRELKWLMEDAVVDHSVFSYKDDERVKMRVEIEELYSLWKQRIQDRRPFQYIVGCEHWRDLVLSVQEGVLIPRPETELIVDLVCDVVSKNEDLKRGVWAELGTGSGALAIGVGQVLGSGGRVIATDLSPVALAVAAYNVQRYCLQDKIELREGSWFEPLKDMEGKLAGLVSNPPYIPSEDISGLQAEVGRHEPRVALDGGTDGMDALRHLCDGAALMLKPGGFFAFETNGEKQCRALVDYMENNRSGSFRNFEILADFAGIQRFVIGFHQ